MPPTLKRVRLFGHSPHVILVHFPIGLLSFAFVGDWLYFILGSTACWHFAYGALLFGVLMAVPTLLWGVWDYGAMPQIPAAVQTATRHMIVNLLAVGAFVGSLYFHILADPPASCTIVLILSTLGMGLLTYGSYLGGNLVYHHHIGIEGENRRP